MRSIPIALDDAYGGEECCALVAINEWVVASDGFKYCGSFREYLRICFFTSERLKRFRDTHSQCSSVAQPNRPASRVYDSGVDGDYFLYRERFHLSARASSAGR